MLTEALSASVGIRVETNSPEVLLRRLRLLAAAHPEFSSLSLCLSRFRPECEVWIFTAKR